MLISPTNQMVDICGITSEHCNNNCYWIVDSQEVLLTGYIVTELLYLVYMAKI